MAIAQRLYPFLYAEDPRAYVSFLARAFGFSERLYHVDPNDDDHVHAEMALGDAVVMIGKAAGRFGTMSSRRAECTATGVYAYVDDVDAHHAQARSAGATIENEPVDQPWGDRMYTARDVEGHRWYFASKR